MKSRRLIALVFGASLLLASAPRLAQAQTTSASGPAGTTTSTATTGGGGGGAASSTSTSTVSAAIGSGLVTNVATIAASSGTPSATTVPSNSNLFGSNYVNYFTLGLPANYQKKFGAQNTSGMTGTFGKYIYVANPSANNAAAPAASNQALGFSTFAQGPRAPAYSTAFAETFPVVLPQLATVQAEARDAIARSSMLKNRTSIQVGTNGAIVLLNGTVGSDTERSVAEGMIRMTPGVQDVQNNLVVDPSKK